MANITTQGKIFYTHPLGNSFADNNNVNRNVLPLGDAPVVPPKGIYRVLFSASCVGTVNSIHRMLLNGCFHGDVPASVTMASYQRHTNISQDIGIVVSTENIVECDGVTVPYFPMTGNHFYGIIFSMEKIA